MVKISKLEHAQTIIDHDDLMKLKLAVRKESTKDALRAAVYFAIDEYPKDKNYDN